MRKAEEMTKYAIENDFADYEKFDTILKQFRVIEKNLLPDEDVIIALKATGVYDGGQIVMGGDVAVAFTNKRCIYGNKDWISGERVKMIKLENVNDVHKDSFGISFGKIEIDTIKEKMNFRMLKKNKTGTASPLDKAFTYIQQYIQEFMQNNNANNGNSQSSAADEIKKYKELLDLGAISQQEFETKKKQLLGL